MERTPATPKVAKWAPGVRVVQLSAGPARAIPKDALWPHMPAFRDAFLRFVSLGALISLGVSSLSIALFAGIAGVWPAKIGGVIVAAVLNFLAARWSIEGRLLK